MTFVKGFTILARAILRDITQINLTITSDQAHYLQYLGQTKDRFRFYTNLVKISRSRILSEMDYLKRMNKNSTNVLQISTALHNMSAVITMKLDQPAANEAEIAELKFLKELPVSENVLISSLACQSLYRLVHIRRLHSDNILPMLISMFPSAHNPMAIVDVIIRILLSDMGYSLDIMEKYRCPYGVLDQQHPIITLLQSRRINMVDITNQLAFIFVDPTL